MNSNTADDMLRVCQRVAHDPYRWLADWKRGSKATVVGHLGLYVPEEIIHAAGLHPVMLREIDKPITQAYGLIQPVFCGFSRNILDLAMDGSLDVLDGLVCQDLCFAIRRLSEMLKRHMKSVRWHAFVHLPVNLKAAWARPFLIEELDRFKKEVEEFAGREITEDGMQRSLALYNEHRDLLRRLYDLRREQPSVIGANEMSAVVAAGMVMPKVDHVTLLRDLLAALPERPARSRPTGPRIFLSGCMCEAPRLGLLELIDEAGGSVVDDDICVGSRYFATAVASEPTALVGWANAYSKMVVPCPTRWDPENDWGDFVLHGVANGGASGVISILVRGCEMHELHYPLVKRKLAAAGIPEMAVETEPQMAIGALKTRIEAFTEMIRDEV